MKTLLILAMAAAITVSAADNTTPRIPTIKEVSEAHRKKQAAEAVTTAQAAAAITELYKAKEWSIESAYTLRTEDLDKYKESVTVGANYFLNKNAGLHAAVGLNDLQGQGVDLVEFGLVARVTPAKSPLAILFGIGAEHRFVNDSDGSPGGWVKDDKSSHKAPATDGKEDNWAVYAEVGLGYRLKYFDPFVKVRGVRPTKSAEGEHIGLFMGVNIPLRFLR